MYTTKNFTSKKALKEAVKAHAEGKGPPVTVYQPGGIFPDPPHPWTGSLEGPHYPKPHTWYAQATTNADGHVIKVS